MEARDYKVTKIDGDYAVLEELKSGGEMRIARALIPEESDEGTLLRWEDLEYTIV